MKLVSVIVAIYNVEKYLRQCLDSIIHQTYHELEIILVDDGSTDECSNICEEYAQTDQRIKVIHKKNAGLGMARNSGLEIASGDFVIYIDSDDWLVNSMIYNMVKAIDENDADFATCGFVKKTDFGSTLSYHKCCEELCVYENDDIQNKILYPILGAPLHYRDDIEREMCVWTNIYKMSIIRQNNIWFVNEREYLSEDLFYNIQYIMHVQRAVLISECLYNHRVNMASLTNIYRPDRYKLLCNLYLKEIEILRINGIYEKAIQRVNRTFIMKTRNAIRILVNSKNISFLDKYYELKKILRDEVIAKVIREYPIEQYTISLRIPALFIKHRMSICLIFEEKLRYFFKKRV